MFTSNGERAATKRAVSF